MHWRRGGGRPLEPLPDGRNSLYFSTMLPLILAMLATQAPDLTVTTFNIRYGTADDGANRWELRRDIFFDALRAQRADLLGLQEALRFQLDEIAAAFPEYDEIGVGRDDGDTLGEYAAILYRADRLEVLDEGTFWLSPTPEVVASTGWGNRITRICTWARFRDHRTGRAFYVYNVHFDHESQPSRERSAELVMQRIGELAHPDPVILLGDFNAGEENPARQLLVRDGTLRDAVRATGRDSAGAGTFHGFTGEPGAEMIDAILVSAEWTVVAARVDRSERDGRYPSDHFAVTVRLRSREVVR